MPSLSPKDRAPLCLFSYEDHRRCRTPRITTHPHFCFYHAQKESQSQATEKLAKDLTYFFSGRYLSANDLNSALGRLIPAVVRGEIKPRVARTVAYMLQTLMQSTRLAQHEYINAFSTDAWRDAIATSVNSNHAHLYPPKPKANSRTQPVQSPARSAPPTPVGAGQARTASSDGPDRATPTPPPSPSQQTHAEKPPTPPPQRPSPADTEAALAVARSIFRGNQAPSQPAESTTNSAHPAPQPASTSPEPTPPTEALSEPRPAFRRRPQASTNSFATNIYTRPGNF